MAPKRKAAKAQKDKDTEQPKQEESKPETAPSESATMADAKQEASPTDNHAEPAKGQDAKAPPSKRKKATETDEPQKAPRRSGRTATKSQPTQSQLLTYLLTNDATELCRPADESTDLEKRGKKTRTYASSPLNPFEELLSAVILSRPISHMLGLRTIRTILNDPYNFTSAKAVKDAGSERVQQAIYDARTQHKDKTAQEIGLIADVVMEKFTTAGDKEGTQLQKVRDESDRDIDEEREMLSQVKGLGKTGLEIYFRRVQWLWEEAFPFVDGKSALGLRKMGLPVEGEELVKALEKVDVGQLEGKDKAQKRRRAFVMVLERVTGADLEGKLDAVTEAAAAT